MHLIEYNGKKPRIEKNVFIAPTAVIIGDVHIAEGASIWYGAVLRGDLNTIEIGAGSNIQDNCTLHVDDGHNLIIGNGVTVGHNCVLHGCTIEDSCLIGMGAIVLNGAHVKKGSIVAAGSVVKENRSVGPNQLAAGSPAAVKRQLSPEIADFNQVFAQTYSELAEGHRQALDKD